MCSHHSDGNVFLVGQEQALGPGSPGTCPKLCFLRQGASVLRSGSPRLGVLSACRGHLSSKLGGERGVGCAEGWCSGAVAAFVSWAGSCIWAGGKGENEEQMGELSCE